MPATAIFALLGLGALALMGGASRGTPRRGAVSARTRRRVRETLATPDDRARSLPIEPAPASVDPDRPGGESMTFRPDAEGRYPGEAGYTDPDAAGADAPADTGPEGSTPDEAASWIPDLDESRRLASSTASAIRSRSTGWRNRLRAFQRAAGLAVDGRYGGLTYNALRYFGIRNPPAALTAPRSSSPAANYVRRVIEGNR